MDLGQFDPSRLVLSASELSPGWQNKGLRPGRSVRLPLRPHESLLTSCTASSRTDLLIPIRAIKQVAPEVTAG